MTIIEKIEAAADDEIVYQIGHFEIISTHENKIALVKNYNGTYFTISDKRGNHLIIENVDWLVDSVLCKKKKRKYHNRTGFRKGEIK